MDEKRNGHTCGECHRVKADKFLVGKVICLEGYGFRRYADKVCRVFKGEASGHEEDASISEK